MTITKIITCFIYDGKTYRRIEYPSGLMWQDSQDHELYHKEHDEPDWEELVDYRYVICAVPRLEILYQQAIKQMPKQPDYSDLITGVDLNLL